MTPEDMEKAMQKKYDRYGSGLMAGGNVAAQSGASGAVSSTLSGAGAGFATGGPVGAVIGGAVGLAGGVLGDKAKAEAEKRQNYLSALKTEMDMKSQAQRELASGYQSGFQNQMAGFGRALG